MCVCKRERARAIWRTFCFCDTTYLTFKQTASSVYNIVMPTHLSMVSVDVKHHERRKLCLVQVELEVGGMETVYLKG